jgi:ubiquitin-protein ligase
MKPWLFRRLERELADHPFTSDGEDETVRFNFGKYAVEAYVGENYPFSPPRLTIDGKTLSYTPTFFPPNLLASYAKEYTCPCCVSITCPDNWSPAFHILDVLREYVDFVEKLKTFQKMRMFRRVALPDDMIYEIGSFLTHNIRD